MGQPPAMVGMMQQTPSLATLNFYAGLANEFEWEQTRTGVFGQTKVLREPVGVVAAVLAWNVPLFLAVNKLSPALLAGCTVLLKPAPESPLSTHLLAEIFAEAGVPEGVISVLPGGARPANTWCRIPGSTRSRSPAAVPSAARSAPSPHRTSSAVPSSWAASRSHHPRGRRPRVHDADAGDVRAHEHRQACVAQTRILAPRSRYDEVLDASWRVPDS